MDILIRGLFLFSPLIFTFYQTTAEDDFGAQSCGVSGNYTLNSTYKSDLDNALNSLAGRNNGFGFYNSKSRQANVAAFCRGDLEPETCLECVVKASSRLPQLCPNQFDAIIWYETCLLRYSNKPMGYGIDESYRIASNSDTISNSSYDQWKQTIANLLEGLRPEAAAGGTLRKYATRSIAANGSVPPIHGYMQCSPDLSSAECDYCLVKATQPSQRSDKSLGMQVYNPSCIVRYEIYSFLNPTWYPPQTPSGERKSTNIGIMVGPILAMLVGTAIVIFIYKQRLQKQKRGSLLPELQDGFSNSLREGNEHEGEDEGTREMNLFKFRTIEVATNNFSAENKLGEGGFGPVYKGELQDGKEIAVKRLSSNSGQGVQEFKTEVQLIIKLQHKNLVRLLGYCIQRSERLLVYEFMANNSLETFLSDPNKCKDLDWAKHANIVTGIAKGLRYLHEDSRLKIIHRDMKASNILLDSELNSKISDFGTARIFGTTEIEANTNRIIGTYGYMAPEYAFDGLFSTKSDVYSFGVLLLEIVSGQKNNRFYFEDEPRNFLLTVWNLWKENKEEQLIDRCLIQNVTIADALRWINIALLCVQEDPQDRPTMSTVVFMLEGKWSSSFPTPFEPRFSFARLPNVLELNTTTYASIESTSSGVDSC